MEAKKGEGYYSSGCVCTWKEARGKDLFPKMGHRNEVSCQGSTTSGGQAPGLLIPVHKKDDIMQL